MSELLELDPPVGHIPGAGIDFTSVGSVHVIEPGLVGPALPRPALPGIRLAAPERLRSVAVRDAAVGDLLVTLSMSAHGADLGRPMQVVHRGDDDVVVLDDRSVERSISVGQSFISAIEFHEPATAWHVLAAFDISRCPRCHSPGQRLVYGMFAGEPSAAYVLAGCEIPSLPAGFQCPRCDAEWPRPDLGDRFN
jgi:hypothetical protein